MSKIKDKMTLNVNDFGIEKECSICREQLLTDVVCCRICCKWIHYSCWIKSARKCPYCKSSEGDRDLSNIERIIRDQLKFKCEGCEIELGHKEMLEHIKSCPKVEVQCKCNKFIPREQLKDHLITCSLVSTATISNQSDDPEIVNVGVTPTMVDLPDDPEIDNVTDPQIDPEIANNVESEKSFSKYKKIAVIIIIVMTYISLSSMYYYALTFEEPNIWYLECSAWINDDRENYNESNPLDLCTELTGEDFWGNDEDGTLEIKYPIREVEESCLVIIIIIFCMSFCFFCYYQKYGLSDGFLMLYLPLFFSCTFFLILLLLREGNGFYVCPKLEDTISYLENDQEKQDEYQDYINITSDECEDLFSHIPGWILIFLIINTSISSCFWMFVTSGNVSF